MLTPTPSLILSCSTTSCEFVCLSVCLVLCIYIKFRAYKWEKYSIYLSESGLSHSPIYLLMDTRLTSNLALRNTASLNLREAEGCSGASCIIWRLQYMNLNLFPQNKSKNNGRSMYVKSYMGGLQIVFGKRTRKCPKKWTLCPKNIMGP